jgi:tRNA A-37 threonylcarbamoyl transferase component Bud32
MHPEPPTVVQPIQPPADVPEIQRGDWFTLPPDDPLVQYMRAELWPGPGQSGTWEAARLSHAAYLYREPITDWTVVVKFYSVKAGSQAERYAGRELECTRQASRAGLCGRPLRAVQPLGTWRGALFFEYVNGLTLEDVIAVRRSRPGTLMPALERAGMLLATLHAHTARPGAIADLASPVAYAVELVDDLTRHGVLQSDPLLSRGLARLIDRWARCQHMADFTPASIHGDATTTNFIYPWDGGVVAIDWERFEVADPASDLGRLMAEVSHSVKQHGGSVAEALPFVQRLSTSYCQTLPANWDADALLKRARFYRAQSTLRIARNGWVSRLDRTALVAQAAVLLAN